MKGTGKTAEAILRFNSPGSAQATAEAELSPSRRFPAVLASSQVIELMELAAARLMRARLTEGESSVAVSTRLGHAALGQFGGGALRAVASWRGQSGRQHHFDVHVFDANGLIAQGVHVRAVVAASGVATVAPARAPAPLPLI